MNNLESKSFWSLNKDKIAFLIMVCSIGGILVSAGLCIALVVTGKETFGLNLLYYTVFGGIGLGIFMALIVLLGSWYALSQSNKYLNYITINDRSKFNNLMIGYTDKGSKWHLFEPQINGFYKKYSFNVYYNPIYNQYDDQRGIHINMFDNNELDDNKRKFIPLKDLKQKGRIELVDVLNEMSK